jgi:hypothetical protein
MLLSHKDDICVALNEINLEEDVSKFKYVYLSSMNFLTAGAQAFFVVDT